MSGPTYCEDCRHCIDRLDGKPLAAWRWLCMARPKMDRTHFVSRTLRLTEPYYRAADVNDGECRHFERTRETPHE